MNLVGRKQVSWHELRLTVPADAAVVEPTAQHALVSSLRVYGHDAADPTGVSFWVMVARQALSPGTSLQQWSDSIIDAAAERRLRVRRQIGSAEVIMAVPRFDEPIGTFVFAVVNGHGYNIMTGAAEDWASQHEIASVLATLQFANSND